MTVRKNVQLSGILSDVCWATKAFLICVLFLSIKLDSRSRFRFQDCCNLDFISFMLHANFFLLFPTNHYDDHGCEKEDWKQTHSKGAGKMFVICKSNSRPVVVDKSEEKNLCISKKRSKINTKISMEILEKFLQHGRFDAFFDCLKWLMFHYRREAFCWRLFQDNLYWIVKAHASKDGKEY